MRESEKALRKVEKEIEEMQRKQERLMQERNTQAIRNMQEMIKRQEAKAQQLAREHERKARNIDKIRDELVKDGLIKSKSSHYEMRLNKRGLFIDDEKQSDAIFQKYKNLLKELTGIDIENGGSFVMNN
jgi:hypothetical protein